MPSKLADFLVAQLERPIVAEHHALAGGGVFGNFDRSLAKGRINVALEEIERFHEVTVAIDVFS
jgi:hypothetical protein